MSNTPKLKPLNTVRPMVACWFVILTCILAGFASAGTGNKPDAGQLLAILCFLLFVFPVYFAWILLYEQQNADRYILCEPHSVSHLRQLSYFVPLFALSGSLSWLTILIWTKPPYIPDVQVFVVRLVVAVAPFYLEMSWRGYDWPNRKNRFTFRYKYFFPAFATCLLPFTYAWSVAAQNSWATPITVIVLVSTWFLSLGRLWPILFVALFASIGAVGLCLFPEVLDFDPALSKALFASILGVLLTLVMGVSESWRATKAISEDKVYIPPTLVLNQANPERFVWVGG